MKDIYPGWQSGRRDRSQADNVPDFEILFQHLGNILVLRGYFSDFQFNQDPSHEYVTTYTVIYSCNWKFFLMNFNEIFAFFQLLIIDFVRTLWYKAVEN